MSQISESYRKFGTNLQPNDGTPRGLKRGDLWLRVRYYPFARHTRGMSGRVQPFCAEIVSHLGQGILETSRCKTLDANGFPF